METEKTRTSGFGSMDIDKQREIARKGGMAAHRKGTAHEFTPEEARNAGRKGGERVSANRSHMVEIGRLGGRKSAERRKTSPRGESSVAHATEARHSAAPQHAVEARHSAELEQESAEGGSGE